jgi:hypothetical protein
MSSSLLFIYISFGEELLMHMSFKEEEEEEGGGGVPLKWTFVVGGGEGSLEEEKFS